MTSLRKFLYRFPRFETSSRVDFIFGDTILLGVCREISESGLRSTFSNTVAPGTEGLITLYLNGKSYSANAVILETQGEETIAKFEFRSDHEREAIREILKLLGPPPEH